MTVLDQAAQADAQAAFAGDLLTPDSPGYDDARRVFNAMIDRRPAAIARCGGVADVIAALALARDNDLPVSVRGGGHAVTGYAIVDDGVVVDMRGMKGIRVNPAERTAWVQAGCNWSEVDRETQVHGLAVTGGRMGDTGVGGLTLGGGSGWIERKYGFTVDSLRAVELVTADGTVMRASADENPELFWAHRGGGGNFGVVTAFEFDLHEVGPVVFGGMMMFPIDAAADLMKAYRAFMEGAPDEICGAMAIMCAPPEDFVPEPVRGKPILTIVCCYVGPVEAGEAAFAPLREWGPAMDMTGPMPYTAVQQLIDGGNPPGRQHYWKAGFLPEMPDEAIDTILAHATDVASPFTATIILPMGGAIQSTPEDDTPLRYRDCKWNYHLLSQWDDPAEAGRNIAWTRAYDQALARFATEGVYANYIAEPPAEIMRRSFGDEKYFRLVAVKDEYDPGNVFCSTQNIPPSV